ncbi:hypothetical protein [Saccharothrix syringae]|uniref:Uncharacterized protein n=1 Tax=Saccharothrix syringae TaxID=103733 RepID=A0A5Q0GX88_SACSY|nr:hypothetical protein [Saccharothrix syringae]QFZ18589.1 hypothetical protein EKG83_14965 [Saccharothrix syringae]
MRTSRHHDQDADRQRDRPGGEAGHRGSLVGSGPHHEADAGTDRWRMTDQGVIDVPFPESDVA